MTPPPALVANRAFRRLFGAQVTSLLGSGVTNVALAAFAYEMAGGRATVVVGTALSLRILAVVTLSPVAGVLADYVDRKRILVGADLMRMALLGCTGDFRIRRCGPTRGRRAEQRPGRWWAIRRPAGPW